jgi:20S proteasome alpha/beta subunit
VSSLEYDFINFDFPSVENERRQNIYPCLIDQQVLTVIIGAKCLDGIVLIADRKLTRKNGKSEYRAKIFGDLEHVLIGYTGDAQIFDIFRRYTVGDVMIERDESKRSTLDNLLSKVSDSIKLFNELVDCRPFKVDYHVDDSGNSNKVLSGYIAIGSGKDMADMFCGRLDHFNIKMKEFIKHAYLAIMFMNNYCPTLGVGVESGGIPDIKYLYYDKEWDKEPAKDSPQDIQDCKNYTNEKLEQFKMFAKE